MIRWSAALPWHQTYREPRKAPAEDAHGPEEDLLGGATWLLARCHPALRARWRHGWRRPVDLRLPEQGAGGRGSPRKQRLAHWRPDPRALWRSPGRHLRAQRRLLLQQEPRLALLANG